MKYELTPQLDSRQSFYRKAIVEDNRLYSYDTFVCEVKDNEYYLNGDISRDLLLSQTTMRHIKEFIYQTLGIIAHKKDLIAHIRG